MADRDPFAASQASDADTPTGFGPGARLVVPIDRRLLIVIAALETGTLAMALGLLIHSGSPWWVFVILIASMGLGIGFIGMLRLVVRFDERRLRLAFPPFYWANIPWSDIADAEPVTADPMRDAGGWGPKTRNGTTWLIAKGGPAVRLRRASGKRPIVFSAPEAETVAVAILERAVAGGAEMTPETPEGATHNGWS